MIKTYRDLLKILQGLELEKSEWIDADISVYDSDNDEYYMAEFLLDHDNDGVLDDGHPLITFPRVVQPLWRELL